MGGMKKLCIVIFMAFVSIIEANKYSAGSNDAVDNPFHMMKVNLVWNKAKFRISDESKLSTLYQDLKYQDQLEGDLKKRKAAGQDEDGEFEAIVRRKFLDIMSKYDMEGLHPDSPPVVGNRPNQVLDKPESNEKWDKVLQDKKLGKLWKKAQLQGFTDKELAALQAELLHHADKVEEVRVLQADLRPDGLQSNSVGSLKDGAEESLQKEREKHIEVKNKYRKLRDNLAELEDKVLSDRSLDERVAGGFRHPKVIDLWFSARNSNFTDKELVSIQEELSHFEHKLMKLETLQEEHEKMTVKLQDKKHQLGDFPHKQAKVEEKVKDFTKKVKKYEHDLRSRINQATAHNEL